jgi:hypothetical protein
VRIHGTILGLTGDALSVRTTGGQTVSVALGPDLRVVAVSAASLADIKPGSFVGSAARPGPDGTLVALEVHIFPESMRGSGEGHRPMDIAPQASMTNGTVGGDVADVSSVAGRIMTVRYNGGEQRIVVPQGVPVVAYKPADRALLVANARVSIAATEAADGTLGTSRITVGTGGIAPPL